MAEAIKWIEAHDALAAWVQAFGAILALSISVWATIHAANATNRAAKQQHEMFIALIEQVTADVYFWVGASPISTKDQVASHVLGTSQEVTEIVERLFETPMSQWPNATLFQNARRLRAILNDLLSTAAKVVAAASDDLQTWELDEVTTRERPEYAVRLQHWRLAKEIDRLMLGCWRTRRALQLPHRRMWGRPFNFGALDYFHSLVGENWMKHRSIVRAPAK